MAGPDDYIDIDVDGRQQFTNVARVLGVVERDIPKNALKEIEKQAKILKAEAASKVPGVAGGQAKGRSKSTGLRQAVAKGVFVSPLVSPLEGGGRDALGFRIGTSMPEEDEAIIPRGLDWRMGWRHPTFGRKGQGDWVTQHGKFSWFLDTMEPAGEILTPKLQDVLDKAANKVDESAK